MSAAISSTMIADPNIGEGPSLENGQISMESWGKNCQDLLGSFFAVMACSLLKEPLGQLTTPELDDDGQLKAFVLAGTALSPDRMAILEKAAGNGDDEQTKRLS